MGWGSGGEVFDHVAHALVGAEVSDELLDEVLYPLAVALTDQDWDTVDASIDEFAGHPVVQHALRKANGSQYLDDPGDRAHGYLEFVGTDDGVGTWELSLDGERVTAEGTVDGFNELITLWAERGDPADAEGKRRYLLI